MQIADPRRASLPQILRSRFARVEQTANEVYGKPKDATGFRCRDCQRFFPNPVAACVDEGGLGGTRGCGSTHIQSIAEYYTRG